jgi:drug/metabolite transporter (DMT)-like permease
VGGAGRHASVAAVLALLAAFLWAAYYPFVLGVRPPTPPAGLLALPFLIGGVAFALAAARGGRGRELARQWTDPRSWGRAALLASMQTSVLAATYLAGAVDSALLSLVGDVVVTPFLLVLLYREGGEKFRSLGFVAGIAACTAGATLTIVAGGSARPLSGWALPVALLVPFLIALYFLFMARASRRAPTSVLASQATIGAGLLLLVVSPLLPGGSAGLLPPSLAALGAVVAIGLTTFYVAPALYFRAIETAGLLLPAVLMATIPIFTFLFAWLLLGIPPTLLGVVGIPIAGAGAVLALRGEHHPWTPEYGAGASSSAKGSP